MPKTNTNTNGVYVGLLGHYTNCLKDRINSFLQGDIYATVLPIQLAQLAQIAQLAHHALSNARLILVISFTNQTDTPIKTFNI